MMRENLERFWQSVARRDRTADGRFVYAVGTTGVYCRPSCPSRRPKQANVAFFDNAAAAERAGYRPCKRCRPQQNSTDPASATVRRACAVIDRALEDGEPAPSLAVLGRAAGSSPFHLQRLFKRTLGISPREYADAQRLARVKARLKEGNGVADALYAAGYGSSSRLYERADAQLGMTPATYRKAGAGAEIRYAISASPLGRLLVAATERGLCAVMLGEDDQRLAAALAKEFSAASIRREDKELGGSVKAIVAHLEGRLPALDLPLDLRASAFQWRVWRELMRIPYGTTATYHTIAERIGKPNAARAVGHACARNPVALAIPCHRVLRADGSLGGYRWGVARKAKLLAQEKAATQQPCPEAALE
ncbi:MAG TPA: bifunctional DNA-binding transcriptional regulator/O6-methylguanine-DNA methyltransferase Ada [Stellaceae bacterium]|nr:bifunctional DNA-binding transcriptional regulator/O6-methylguanine-DNA methyltransferase Ada [Stellaceae bacterium]